MKANFSRLMILLTAAAALSACSRSGFKSTAQDSVARDAQRAGDADDTIIPPPGTLLPVTPRPSEPSEPVEPPVNPPPPPPQPPQPPPPVPPVPPTPVPGGWNILDGGMCSGEAWYGGVVNCYGFRALCTGSSACPFDRAVAHCNYTYTQGASDFRLQPGRWEWFTDNMDHLPVGWGCVVQPRGTVAGVLPEVDPLVFNAAYYLANNPDLKAAFGTDEGMAKAHWRVAGINEGRRASAGFSTKIYLARYADLRAAFGANNYAAAIEHYVNHGLAEGRSGN